MSNTFTSWQELFVHLKSQKYKISSALKKSIIEPKNETLPPIILQNISESSITLAYLESIQSSQLWPTLPKLASLTQTLNISTHLPLINNSIITIQDFQTSNPIFYINIPQVSPTEAATLLDSFSELPKFIKDIFSQLDSLEIQLSNDLINFHCVGEIDIQEIVKHLCSDLALKKVKAAIGAFIVANPTINIQVLGNQSISYQVIIPELNPEYLTTLFNNLAGINLPDGLKSKLESLEQVGLILSPTGIYLNIANDLQLKLEDIFSIDAAVPYMETAINGMISGIFGNPELTISAPKLGIIKNKRGVDISFKGILNNQNLALTFGNQTTLHYQLPSDIDFSSLTNEIPVIQDLQLTNAELIITNIGYAYKHEKLGRINFCRGFNFIGDINFTQLNTNFGDFIQNKLDVGCLGVLISFDPGGFVSLTGNIQGNVQLFSIDRFNATFSNLLIGLDVGVDLEPSFGLTGNLAVQGYDPTQDDEPTLYLCGKLSLEPESLTGLFSQQGENSWYNPYGLVGTELRNVGFQGGGTYLPPYFDNFGFIGDLRWEKIDLAVAFLIDTNDPEKLAFILTTNQPINLIDLWQGPVSGFVLKQANSSIDVVNKALDFLNNFLDLNITSVDSDDNGELNPLIKFVPFSTTIAGQPVSEGLEINGKMTAWGHEAILILQSDKTFRKIEGSLKVPEIDLGFLKITGTDDDSLDLALKVTPDDQYLTGDGYVEIFDNQVANVEFQITPTNAIFKDFDLSLANLLTIDVDDLSIEHQSGIGSGSGTISVLGNTLVGITFDVTSNSVTLKNTKLNLAGFLTVEVDLLTVNLKNQSATGTANITAFNQSLGKGILSFNPESVTIDHASLSLGNVMKLNVPNFHLDLTHQKLLGLGDITLLGKEFTSLSINLDESGFQASSNFNFGIVAFNGATVTLTTGDNGNINNSASIEGNLKFLGYDFADINASVNSNQLTASGCFNFGGIFILKGAKNQKNAKITLNKAENGLYNAVRISGSCYLLGNELSSINVYNKRAILKVLGIKLKSRKTSDNKM